MGAAPGGVRGVHGRQSTTAGHPRLGGGARPGGGGGVQLHGSPQADGGVMTILSDSGNTAAPGGSSGGGAQGGRSAGGSHAADNGHVKHPWGRDLHPQHHDAGERNPAYARRLNAPDPRSNHPADVEARGQSAHSLRTDHGGTESHGDADDVLNAAVGPGAEQSHLIRVGDGGIISTQYDDGTVGIGVADLDSGGNPLAAQLLGRFTPEQIAELQSDALQLVGLGDVFPGRITRPTDPMSYLDPSTLPPMAPSWMSSAPMVYGLVDAILALGRQYQFDRAEHEAWLRQRFPGRGPGVGPFDQPGGLVIPDPFAPGAPFGPTVDDDGLPSADPPARPVPPSQTYQPRPPAFNPGLLHNLFPRFFPSNAPPGNLARNPQDMPNAPYPWQGPPSPLNPPGTTTPPAFPPLSANPGQRPPGPAPGVIPPGLFAPPSPPQGPPIGGVGGGFDPPERGPDY
jgi:hypothetical protein